MTQAVSQLPEDVLSPRSQLLVAFFERLNRERVVFAVMNNYEELPRVIPSDVDITVPAGLFARLDRFIVDFAGSVDALVVQKLWHGNQKCAYILGTGSDGAREFIQLDFFVAFSTKGCPALLSHERLIAGGRELRGFRVPAPEVELVFTGMRRLFKDDWSERHCLRIKELRGRITTDAWLPPRYAWLRKTLEAAIDGDLVTVRSRRAADWAGLRKSSRGNLSLSERLANAAQQMRRIIRRLRDETGQIIVWTGRGEPVDTGAVELLQLVFHRHLRLDEAHLAPLGTLARLLLPARLALLKRRKGFVFLHVEPDRRLSRNLALRLDRLGLIDLQLMVGTESAPIALSAPVATVTTSAQTITAIVTRQAEKTARAIARGGSQTSE